MNRQLDLFTGTPDKKYEYFVLVSPNAEISARIKKEKLKLHHEIGLDAANLHSVPHISLLKCHAFGQEELMLSLIKKALLTVKSFLAEIKALEVFNHGDKRSIVLTFNEPERFRSVFAILLRGLGFRAASINPHLTLARSVSFEDFNRIKNIQDYFFKGSFRCDQITVLRKEQRSGQKYEVIEKIDLVR